MDPHQLGRSAARLWKLIEQRAATDADTRAIDQRIWDLFGEEWAAGRVLRIGDEDVWGQEVNAASKLGEDTAKSNEILLTAAAKAALGETPDLSFESIGAVTGSEENYRLVLAP